MKIIEMVRSLIAAPTRKPISTVSKLTQRYSRYSRAGYKDETLGYGRLGFPNLEALRLAYGYNIKELAYAAGKTHSTYYRWQMLGDMKASDVIALADLFGVSIDVILDFEPLPAYVLEMVAWRED